MTYAGSQKRNLAANSEAGMVTQSDPDEFLFPSILKCISSQ